MYRFTTLLSQSHLVLVRKKLSDGSCAALLVMRAPVRQYAQDHFAEKCPPVAPVKKSRKLLYSLIGVTIATGTAVVYAKNSPKVRGWLQENVPWADRFVGLVYQEETTYYDFTVNHLEKMKVAVTGFLFGKEGISPLEFKQQAEQDLDKDAEEGFAPKTYPLPPPVLEPLYVEEKEPGQAEVEIQATLVQTEKCEPEEPPPVNITKDVLTHEQNMFKYTRVAIDTYKNAKKVTAEYNKMLSRVIESPPGNPNLFGSLKGLRAERDKLREEANAAAAVANCSLDTLERMLAEGSISAPPSNLTQTKRFIVSFRKDLSEAIKEYKEEEAKSDITDKYWEKIEAARKLFQTELTTLFPDVDLCAHKLDLKGEVDLFILFCANQIQYLQNSIAEMQTILEKKIDKAVECMDEASIVQAKAAEMLTKERISKEIDFQKKALKMQVEAHKKHKQELHKQAEIQERLAQQKIAKMEQEINAKANKRASEEIVAERVKFKKELAAIAGKLKALEQTLKQRAAAEQEARRSQAIWAAAEALLQATRRCTPTTKVDTEIKALEKAGEKDKLVQTVLKGIPRETKDKGIVTEKALKDRFDTLEETAVKVALIGKTGGSLPMYFLSWVQSKLLFQKFAAIPQNELDNLPTDFTQLDTFDIMHRARYHMDHGDLGAALRYVNLLQGAPRAAAACWLEAARDHLEVRQAAQTVMAHACLSGMLYNS